MTEGYGDREKTCIRKHPLSVPGEISGIQVMQMILRDFVKEDAPIIAGFCERRRTDHSRLDPVRGRTV